MRGTGTKIGLAVELIEIVVLYASVQFAGLYFLSKLFL